MPFNPAISSVDIYSREFHAHEHKEIPKSSLSEAVFVIVKTRQNVKTQTKQSKTENKQTYKSRRNK